jgi:hypothetical protein
MKLQAKKIFTYLLIGFVVLFVFRLLYGYRVPPEARNEGQGDSAIFDFDFSGKNYASEKLLKKSSLQDTQTFSVDQKYEKIASLSALAPNFEDDEKRLRELTAQHGALIQYEQNSGLKGKRRLNLAIGVPPQQFDAFVTEARKIGRLLSIRIDKTDKTNEYKDLQAKRASLEKTREGLIGLKSKGGSIEESINLESKILEIESEIQDLGVSLGEYDQENEFCTVKMTLQELPASGAISFIHRVKVAFEWTIKIYLRFLGILLLAVAVAYGAALAIREIKKNLSGRETTENSKEKFDETAQDR